MGSLKQFSRIFGCLIRLVKMFFRTSPVWSARGGGNKKQQRIFWNHKQLWAFGPAKTTHLKGLRNLVVSDSKTVDPKGNVIWWSQIYLMEPTERIE